MRQYEVRGIVRGFSPDRQTIDIQHEDIPGFMPSMTMPFSVRNRNEIVDLVISDAVAFRMTVTEKDFWIDRIRKIQPEDMNLPESTLPPAVSDATARRLHEGDEMPAFELTNQNGERISLESFHGRPFVLNFIFTRCPVPNFCPRMSNNFGALQNAIKNGGDDLAQTRLFSITLDPTFDTPEILKQYGESHAADGKIWSLATGDSKEVEALTQAFSVYRQTEAGTISHGLATALIDKNGKIDKIWRGNSWTPEEVINEIKQHAK